MKFIKKYFPPLFFIFSIAIFLKAFLLPGYPDFLVHYYSPQVLLAGGNPYTFGRLAFFPDVYPPATIMFFFPFILLPLPAAEKLWFVVSLICLFLSVYLIFKIAKKKFFSGLGLMVLAFIFLSFPVKFNFGMGQINTLVLFLTCLSVYFFNDKRFFFIRRLPGPISVDEVFSSFPACIFFNIQKMEIFALVIFDFRIITLNYFLDLSRAGNLFLHKSCLSVHRRMET